MRQLLLGFLGVMAAGATHAETYSFTTVTDDMHLYQTLIFCHGPKTNGGLVPTGCTLSEPSIAYPNHTDRGNNSNNSDNHERSTGVTCARDYPIVFHANGTLAECVLAAQQPEEMRDLTVNVRGLAACKGLVRFDRKGRADC
jgi:hypothetical protein